MKILIITAILTILAASPSVSWSKRYDPSAVITTPYTGETKFELGFRQASFLPKMAEVLRAQPEWRRQGNAPIELVILNSENSVDGRNAIAKLFGESSPILRIKALDVFRASRLKVIMPSRSTDIMEQCFLNRRSGEKVKNRYVLKASVTNFDRAIEVKQKGWQPFYEGTNSFVGANRGTGYVKDQFQLSMQLMDCNDDSAMFAATELIPIKSVSSDKSWDFFASRIGMFYANFESRSLGLNYVKEMGYEFLLTVMIMKLLNVPEEEQKDFFDTAYEPPKTLEEIVVQGSYKPKRTASHYFTRNALRGSKCSISKGVRCKINFDGRNLYDAAFYIQTAMRLAIPSPDANVKCDVNRRRGTVECKASGDLNGFSSERMFNYLRA